MTAGASVDVVTVTVNPAVDQTLWIPGFAVDAVNRVEREATRPGGKGVNVAARLAELGVGVAATGVLGIDNAPAFETFLADRGVIDRFVRRPGSTRTGIKIVDPEGDRTTDINFGGETPGAAALAEVEDRVSQLAATARWVVLAGSLPPGVPADLYHRLIEVAHERGASVALDTSGAALRTAIVARPDLVKPNEHELAELLGRSIDGDGAIVEAARELLAAGISTVVVSRGAAGASFVTERAACAAAPLAATVTSTVGAGDAMVAGMVAGLLAHRPLREVASLATACAAMAISALDPRLDAAAVEALARTVQISDIQGES